jgi:hypothetical protein
VHEPHWQVGGVARDGYEPPLEEEEEEEEEKKVSILQPVFTA